MQCPRVTALDFTSGVFDCEIPPDNRSFNLAYNREVVLHGDMQQQKMNIQIFESAMQCDFLSENESLVTFCRDLLEFCEETFYAEVCMFGLPRGDAQKLVLMQILVKIFGFTFGRDESGIFLRGEL